MRAIVLIVGILLVPASALFAQTPQQVADGVYVLPLPDRNAGWLEFEDHVMVIDACDDPTWDTLTENLRGISSKPVRYVAHTHGSAAADCVAPPNGVLLLVPSETGLTEIRNGIPSIASDVVMEDASQRAVLRRVHVGGGADAWTVLVDGSEVLFAGDLIGFGRHSVPLPIEDWISEVRRLSRLNPNVVVPGRGPIVDSLMIQETHRILMQTRDAIRNMVDDGRSRSETIERVEAFRQGSLPVGAVEHLYDEHVGILPATAFVERLGLREGPSPTAGSADWTAPKKIVVADLWPGRTEQIGLAAPGVEVFVARDSEHAADLVDEVDADAVLGWLTPEILERGKGLRWVSLLSAGIESYLEIPGFAESDIVLTNGQRLYANGGAEHVLGLILSLSRRLFTAARLQSERRWDTVPLSGPTPITGAGSELGELRGKTILVVGLGGIGTEVARLAHGIGMRVIATRASTREGPPFVDYVGFSDELLDLAWDAHVIVNCLPLTPDTEGLFDDQFFRLANSDAFFINIGRGGTVDTDALVRALRDGRIAGAALDVTDPEPLPPEHELWGMPNVIITPHVGGDSERHMERIWMLFRENLRRFSLGEPLLSVVDKARGY